MRQSAGKSSLFNATERTGEPLVSFRLTEASRLVFADFTARNVGRKVDRRVDGRVMTLR